MCKKFIVGGAETPVNGQKDGAWLLLARWRRLNKLLCGLNDS